MNRYPLLAAVVAAVALWAGVAGAQGAYPNKPVALIVPNPPGGLVDTIGTEMFKARTGTSMVHIPYRGSGAAIQDVLSGQVQVFMSTPPSLMQHVQSGKLKAFAVTGQSRHPGLPDVPTTAEAGLQGFELESWVAIFAPAGTPPDVVGKITGAIRQALATPEAKSRADAAGIEIRYQTPAQLDAMVKTETEFWAKTIKAAGITAD